nr:MAG TPA_asm: hypothetical protein [Caudoviricetes sp.]
MGITIPLHLNYLVNETLIRMPSSARQDPKVLMR